MSRNFFETDCMEPSRSDELFGICDDQDGAKAYTIATDNARWIATVINKNQKAISFTAIDNCVVVKKEGTKDRESSCDGMLTFSNSLFLVELKKQGTCGWLSKATSQLENTIRMLSATHNLSRYRYKKAYICNKKYPYFQSIKHSEQQVFFRKTKGFRLDVHAEIVIR
jgi:hypothetical protein